MSSDRASEITIREATIHDIPEIVRQRRRMYEDMRYTDIEGLERSSSLNYAYFRRAIPEGSFRAWLAYDGERAIAGGAVLIVPWPAHPYDLECRRATILNVYTEPDYRRRGIARRIMQETHNRVGKRIERMMHEHVARRDHIERRSSGLSIAERPP